MWNVDIQSMRRTLLRSAALCLLIAALAVCVAGCTRKNNTTANDTSLCFVKSEYGAELRRGQNGNVIARLEVPIDENGVHTGDMRLYLGGELWMRIWKETDQGVRKVYLQTPDGATLIDSWPESDGDRATNVQYIGSDTSTNGVSVGFELPPTDSTTSFVLLDIDDDGTLQLNVYIDRKTAGGEKEQYSSRHIFRLVNDTWCAEDRVASVASYIAPATSTGLPEGRYTVNVDVARDGETRQLEWERTGLGEDGYRYRLRCVTNGTQVALLQTLRDTLGDVVIETADFSGEMPFTVDEDNRVRSDGSKYLLEGLTTEYAFGYDGTTVTAQLPVALKSGNVGGFASSLYLSDDLYEGDRAEDGQLTRPKYRKYVYLDFTDEITQTNVEMPVACGRWLPVEGELPGDSPKTVTRLTLTPEENSGWKVSGYTDSVLTSSQIPLGTVLLGSATDENGALVYTGEFTLDLGERAPALRLYRQLNGKSCGVYAQCGERTWLLATIPVDIADAGNAENSENTENTGDTENTGETENTDNTDNTESMPNLTVSRYVELQDYETPLTLYKLLYTVSLPDGTLVAQFLSTNEGRLIVRLYSADREIDCEYRYSGEKQSLASAVTEKAKNSDTYKTERVYETLSPAVTTDIAFDGSDGTRYSYLAKAGDRTEVAIDVHVSGNGDVTVDTFAILDSKTGSETEPISIKGGLLYAGTSCIDGLSLGSLRIANTNGSVKTYCPVEDWVNYDTEHFLVSLRVAREYREAEKTLDGTVLTPAMVRRIVWVEVTERSTGDSWSCPIGYGSWTKAETR